MGHSTTCFVTAPPDFAICVICLDVLCEATEVSSSFASLSRPQNLDKAASALYPSFDSRRYVRQLTFTLLDLDLWGSPHAVLEVFSKSSKLSNLSRRRRQQERQTSEDYATYHKCFTVNTFQPRLTYMRRETNLADFVSRDLARLVDTKNMAATGLELSVIYVRTEPK